MNKVFSKVFYVKFLAYVIISLAIVFILLSIFLERKTSSINLSYNLSDKLGKVVVFDTTSIKNIHFYENNDNNIISINIIFKGGASLDPIGQEGLTYFLSNVIGTGAGGLSPQEFQKILDDFSIKLSISSDEDSLTIQLKTLTYYRSKAFEILDMIINSPNFSTNEINLVKSNIEA